MRLAPFSHPCAASESAVALSSLRGSAAAMENQIASVSGRSPATDERCIESGPGSEPSAIRHPLSASFLSTL
jgi:hypothetical protein